jgi:hypothetical protein
MLCGYRPPSHPWWQCQLPSGHYGWHRPVREPNVTRKPCGCATQAATEDGPPGRTWPCPEHTPPPATPPATLRPLPDAWPMAHRKHRKKEPKRA